MEGYVKFLGVAPMYIFKGVVAPGGRINFDVLVEKFKDVADVSSSKSFAKWLLENKFSNTGFWQIVPGKEENKKEIKEEIKIVNVEVAKEFEVVEEKMPPAEKKDDEIVTFVKTAKEVEKDIRAKKITAVNKEILKVNVAGVKKEMTVGDITSLKIPEIKKVLSKIRDNKLLNLALKKAEGMQRKAMLCNALRDRIIELST